MITVNKVIKIVANSLDCPIDTLSSESGLGKHYKWDSLGHITVMISLEKEFDLEVNEDNIEKLRTIDDIVGYLNSHKTPPERRTARNKRS